MFFVPGSKKHSIYSVFWAAISKNTSIYAVFIMLQELFFPCKSHQTRGKLQCSVLGMLLGFVGVGGRVAGGWGRSPSVQYSPE